MPPRWVCQCCTHVPPLPCPPLVLLCAKLLATGGSPGMVGGGHRGTDPCRGVPTGCACLLPTPPHHDKAKRPPLPSLCKFCTVPESESLVSWGKKKKRENKKIKMKSKNKTLFIAMSLGRHNIPLSCPLPQILGPGCCFVPCLLRDGMSCVRSARRTEGAPWKINSGRSLAAAVSGLFFPARGGSGSAAT